MYSFAERDDTRVVDEPLYGHYLRVTGTAHPGRDEVIAAMDCDGDRVMRQLLDQHEPGKDYLFLKQMAHHLVDIDTAFLELTRNVFLIRDPEQMLPSLTIQLPRAGLDDTGLKRQWLLYEQLVDAGQDPAVIESRELLLDPRGVLRKLCERLGMPYTDAMLSWEAGPRDEDGVWAPHWYHAVHRSTGFSAYVHKTEFPDALRPLLAECAPWYDKLMTRAIRAAAPRERER
jgi:hypothetical protein